MERKHPYALISDASSEKKPNVSGLRAVRALRESNREQDLYPGGSDNVTNCPWLPRMPKSFSSY